jgi:hypothetical protein
MAVVSSFSIYTTAAHSIHAFSSEAGIEVYHDHVTGTWQTKYNSVKIIVLILKYMKDHVHITIFQWKVKLYCWESNICVLDVDVLTLFWK